MDIGSDPLISARRTSRPVPPGSLTLPGRLLAGASIGKFRIIECHTIDGGYLYLQAQGAITDDSGIVYLPADAESQWRTTERMTSLGGPWWSWTCRC